MRTESVAKTNNNRDVIELIVYFFYPVSHTNSIAAVVVLLIDERIT